MGMLTAFLSKVFCKKGKENDTIAVCLKPMIAISGVARAFRVGQLFTRRTKVRKEMNKNSGIREKTWICIYTNKVKVFKRCKIYF